MSKTQQKSESIALKLQIPKNLPLTDEIFFELCQENRDVRLEKNAEGALIIMPPTGGKTGRRNFKLSKIFGDLEDLNKEWVGFDSSTGFKLANGAIRSPDVAFMKRARWESLSDEEQDKFIPITPEFVVELRSPTDSIESLKDKMKEYLDNGVKLGWLIDPINRAIYIYKANAKPIHLKNPEKISAAPLIPQFSLELKLIWDKL